MGKKTCKVFTPPDMVVYMLDKIGYTDDLLGKKVLENSCGTGHFLQEIVRRYIRDVRTRQVTDEDIKSGLEADIHGYEKDSEVYEQCLANLDKTAAELGIHDVAWHITKGDALRAELSPGYQYVIGNPPYITYYNLDSEDRALIRRQYEVCRVGKADYYYAFTEAALKSLAADGKMAYLIPNNFMKNRYSQALREYLIPYLTEIEDYKFLRIFGNYQISSAIIFCENQCQQDDFKYTDQEIGDIIRVKKRELTGKWTFCSSEESKKKTRLGDCFKVSAPVATLLNDAFVIQDFSENEAWIETNGYRLERLGLRPAASPKSRQYDKNNYIIFPYYYMSVRLCRYTEEEFHEKFPEIERYLQTYRDKLDLRQKDKACKWFEYGRSQALAHINQEKLMLSTLITDTVKYYQLDEETVPYSGMYLVPKTGYTIEQAKDILESDAFYQYIQSIGIHANGKTYRISPSDVENYTFEEKW